MPAPRKYPDELRERAVRLVFESGRPIAHVAADLGVHRESLRHWVRRAEADAGARKMRTAGIEGAKRRGKPWRTTTPDPGAARRPDLVQRDFTAARPNSLWVADLTYLRCWQGLVFFAFVIDAFSRRVVGWQFAAHMRTDLVLDALGMALHQRGPGADVELVHHSDRGSPNTPRSTTPKS
ncbi:MAG: DDE-type integrase/transposase/recombinase [Actinobacteria bacterium]|nr:DDE-type integrase/transposase/recombinase [Actinomycetota bacterium]